MFNRALLLKKINGNVCDTPSPGSPLAKPYTSPIMPVANVQALGTMALAYSCSPAHHRPGRGCSLRTR